MKKDIQKAEIVPQKKKSNFKISLTYDPHKRKVEFKAPSAIENAFQLFLTKVANRVADGIIEKVEDKFFRRGK